MSVNIGAEVAKRPNRNFENDGKTNDKLRSLQKALKERDKEIARLKQELATLNKAFEKSAAYMSSQSKELSVQDLIKAANKGQTLEQTKKVKESETVEDVRDKVLKWRNERFGKYEEE